ncbi:MAG TPA: sialidase family protein [bacterium]|nr:sialidase family protein [bacterium]
MAYVRPVGGVDQIFLAESADRGRSWRHEQITAGPRPARLPSVAGSADGTLHLVWTEYTPTGRVLYRLRRGGRWSDVVTLSAPGVYAGVPVVAVAGSRVHVLWYGIRAGAVPAPRRHGSLYEILATRFEGGRWLPPSVISPGLPDSINPSLAPGVGETAHAAWYQFDGRVYQVRYARFEGGWLPPRSLTTDRAEHTAVALDAAGAQFHLVWVEQGAARRVMTRSFVAGPMGLPGGVAQALSGAGDVGDPVVVASGLWVAAAWRSGRQVMFRQIRPKTPPVPLGMGEGPALAISGDTAFVAWTRRTGERHDLLLGVHPLR